MAHVCFGCNKVKSGKEVGDHFCRTLNLFICGKCYNRDQHDMYCGDPDVPLRVYPSVLPKHTNNCLSHGHHYAHIQELGYTFISCTECKSLVCVPLNSSEQSSVKNNTHENINILYFSKRYCTLPRTHNYQPISSSAGGLLYCRQCANLVYT